MTPLVSSKLLQRGHTRGIMVDLLEKKRNSIAYTLEVRFFR